jgi:gamma-glutamyl-gamma-aminobutyrate hydrolase PuuD
MRFEYAAFNDLRVTITLTVDEIKLLNRLVQTVNHETKDYAKAFREAAKFEFNSFHEFEMNELASNLKKTKASLLDAMRRAADYNDALDGLE